MKITCFLDNLANPTTSQAVTIDTHMQKFILGAGHMSLAPHEYAVRACAVDICCSLYDNITLPTRMRHVLWRIYVVLYNIPCR